jgi:hypothetical protein
MECVPPLLCPTKKTLIMESKDLVNEEKEELLALLLKEEGFGILPEQVIAPQEKKGEVLLNPADIASKFDLTLYVQERQDMLLSVASQSHKANG